MYWWPKYDRELFDFRKTLIETNTPKPTMEGNIQVIFYLLVIGLAGALLLFVVENLKTMYIKLIQVFKVIFNYFLSQCYLLNCIGNRVEVINEPFFEILR